MPTFKKPIAIALVYGFAAGAVAAIVLWLMLSVQSLLWSHNLADRPGYIVAMIMAGGGLLALLQYMRHGGTAQDGGVREQLADLPLRAAGKAGQLNKRRDIALLALSAIVAVGFGGAVGPEAGLLAVVAECSAIVSALLAKTQAEQRLIHETGAVAALAGLYAAPPGAAMLLDEQEDAAPKQPTSPAAPSRSAPDLHAAEAGQATPLPIKLLAGVSGFGGFLCLKRGLLPGDFQPLPLPAHTLPGDGSDMLLALPSALAGAALGLLFVYLHRLVPQWLQRVGGPTQQILLGTTIFAALAAAFPLLRFSGHHELEHALEHGIHLGVWPLLGLALGKVVAMSVCLASGWRGGEFFPAMFAASALAAAVHVWLPDIGLTVAIMGGAGAMVTVCMGKPMAVLLIMLLVAGLAAPGALFTGILVGYGARRVLAPRAEAAQHH